MAKKPTTRQKNQPATATRATAPAAAIGNREALLRREIELRESQASNVAISEIMALLGRMSATADRARGRRMTASPEAMAPEVPGSECEAALLYTREMQDLWLYLEDRLPARDPRVMRAHSDYLAASRKDDVACDPGAIQAIDPGRAERIARLVGKLAAARKASAAAEELIQIATELANEFA